MEGLLKITGVRWTLSDSVIGYRYFEFDMKGKQKKGRRALNSLSTKLEFLVIKVCILLFYFTMEWEK